MQSRRKLLFSCAFCRRELAQHIAKHAFFSTICQLLYLDNSASGRLLQCENDEVCGDASLWQEVLAVDRAYQQSGLPKRRQFTFCVEQGRQLMLHNGQCRVFAERDSW